MTDVFLSYNSRNRHEVAEIDGFLRERGIATWFDDRDLEAGDPVWREIDEGLRESGVCLVFLGREGLGRYQEQEVELAITLYQDVSVEFRIVPLLLPGVGEEILQDLPATLRAFSRVELRDLGDHDTLERLASALRRDSDVCCVFEFVPVADGEGYRLRLSVDGGTPCEEDFAFDLDPSLRTHSEVLPKIEGPDCHLDDLRDIGGQLWDALDHGAVGEEFRRARGLLRPGKALHLRLRLPPELESLPWEALHEPRIGFLSCEERVSVVRDVADPTGPVLPVVAKPQPEGPLRILTLVPAGAELDGDREVDALTGRRHYGFEAVNNAIEQFGGATEVRTLTGQVTQRQVDEVLQDQDFDIVHFVGHGDRNMAGSTLRFNAEGDGLEPDPISPTLFASLFGAEARVRLVILNCCFSGESSGPNEGSFGATLLERGIPAVITMRSEIHDQVAIAFSEIFYEHLLSTPRPGRIDFALERTRRHLLMRFKNERPRAFVTPQLHLASGNDAHFEIQRPYVRPRPKPLVDDRDEADFELPSGLIKAFGKGRVVLILGPGVLRLESVRDGGPNPAGPPGPRQLAERLDRRLQSSQGARPFAEHSHGLELFEGPGEWLHTALLQRVCQFYEGMIDRTEIVDEIERIYSRVELPQALVNIASWPFAGVFCTFFDGLLRRAIGTQREVVEVHRIDRDFERQAGTLTLVELRGSLRQPGSLVLTAADEQELVWEHISRMPAQMQRLGGYGMALLVLGCSPRDPLVLRLIHKLRGTIKEKDKKLIVAAPRCSAVDRALWHELHDKCKWILGDLELIIQRISDGLEELE